MSKQTFSIFQIFALYFPFCMRPYDARSSVTLEKLGFVVREPQSHLELTYFLPKISAFMLISGNWANVYVSVLVGWPLKLYCHPLVLGLLPFHLHLNTHPQSQLLDN